MAVENLGVLAAGATIASADQTLALRRLNVIAKMFQGRADGSPGLKPHTRQRVTLLLQEGQQSYLVGPGSSDARASTQMGRTTISADEASGQTVISVTSNTDTTTYPGTTLTMANNDIVAIQQNDGTLHFTTISGTPGATMTIAAQLTDAADAGKYVYWFTSRAQRLIHVESAVIRDENYTTTPLEIFRTVQDYELGVSDKYSDGQPTAILVEALLTNTRVTLNSQPTNVAEQIILTGWYPSEDYDAAANDIAYPQEAYRWLSWELAFEIHPSFGAQWTPAMEQLRQESRAAYLGLNPEVSNLYFQSGT